MPRDAGGSSPPRRRGHSPPKPAEAKSSRQRTASAEGSRRHVHLTAAPQDLATHEQVNALQRQVTSLEEKLSSIHKMLSKVLQPSHASSEPPAPGNDENDEPWPVCACGNLAPRNNQWCRSCRDIWTKKQEKEKLAGKGKGKD